MKNLNETNNPDRRSGRMIVSINLLCRKSANLFITLFMTAIMLASANCAWAQTVTATWNFRSGGNMWSDSHANSLNSFNGITHILSDKTEIAMTVDASAGKFHTNGRTDWAQINKNTKIYVPVVSTDDKISVWVYENNKFTIGATDITGTSIEDYEVSSGEVNKGYVEITCNSDSYLGKITATLHNNVSFTAKWDWKNSDLPSTQGTNKRGSLASDFSGVSLDYFGKTEASYVKIWDNGDNAHFYTGTILRIPVKAAGDKITVVSYPGKHNYDISNYTATKDTETYTVTSADVAAGHVDVEATTESYLYSITLEHKQQNDFALTMNGSYPFFGNSVVNDKPYYVVASSNTVAYMTDTKPDYYAAEMSFKTYNGGEHGYENMVANIPVLPGRYEVTIGNCGVSSESGKYALTVDHGTVTPALINASSGCYHQNIENNKTTETITITEPATLHIQYGGGSSIYTPYFAISKINESGHTLNVTIEPENAGTVAAAGGKYPAGAVELRAVAKTGYQFVKWTTEDDTELSTNNPYNYDMPDEDVTLKAVFEALSSYTLSFSAGDVTGIEGTMPADVVLYAGETYTVPDNQTLYKEGYTFTGWTDGETTWNVSQQIPAATKTLNPVFTQNTTDIANRTGAVTVKWDFQTKAKAPLIQANGSTAFLVAQATIDTKKVDVKLSIDATSGKYDNQNGNWAQVNSGTKFYFPSAKDAVVTAFVYQPVVASGTTIDNQQPTMIDGNNARVTVNTAKNTNELVVDSDIQYIRSINIDFPAHISSDLTRITESKTMMVGREYTITGADYTTSSAGAFSYTSSNETVATVDATGKITALAAGTSTITITQAPDNTYAGSSFDITVTVEAVPTAFVAVWDWENTIPSTIRANYSTGGLINSSVDGAESTKYQLEIQNGNVSGADRDNLYVNNGVEVKIPVVSVGDLIEVKFHTHESTWQRTTIDGKAIEDNQFIKHYVTSEDAEREYAILKANGGGLYLYSIKLIHNQLTTFNEISYTFPKDGTSTGVILDGTGTKVTSVPVDGYIGAYFTAATTDNVHGHTGIDLAIPVLKGTYNLKLGQCFYNVHGYTVKTTDGLSKDISVTKAKSSVDKTCYDNSHKELVVPVKISLSNDGYILVSGGSQSYLPFFSVTKLAVPTITVQPRATAQMTQGDAEGVELSIEAIDTDDWSYQWYTCDDAKGNNPQAIDGATSASYTYHSDTPGTYYLYCALKKDAQEPVTSAVSTVTVMESRTFVDFKIDFRARPTVDDDYTKVEPAEELPAGEFTFVSQEKEAQYAQHGAHQPVFKVTVDGPVRFKIAQSHNTKATDFTIAVTGTGVNETLNNYGAADAKPTDLASATYNNYITYIYNEEPASPVELTFTCNGYLPYIIAEKIRKATEYDVTYYNPDASAIGEAIKTPAGSTLFFKKTASDVTVDPGKKFRGWFDSTADNANKIAEGVTVNSNMNLYAKATDEETSEPGHTYNFDFTKGIYDFTNHDIIKTNGGNGRSDGHGWEYKNTGGKMSVYVPGDAKLSFTICRYTNAQNITVTDGEGNQVGETFVFAKEDEQVKEIVVERNYTGPATWLSINYATSGFIHDVTVTNLAASDLTKIQDVNVETKLSHTLTNGVDYSTSSDGAMTFSSDNTAVATVSDAGVIGGVSVGTANITLTQAASETHCGGSITFAVTVTKSNITDGHPLTIGQDIAKLTGTNGNWANSVKYPMTFAVQGASFGDGDGSAEGTHVNISEVGSIYFDVSQGSTNNGGVALRSWIWDTTNKTVQTLYPHPLEDYASAPASTWTTEYRIQDPGVYRVNVNAWDHLKGVKAANNWGANPITVDFAFTEGLDNSEGTQYTKVAECLATGDANTIPTGWTVYSDGVLREGGTGWGSGGRVFDSKDGKGVYTRAAGGEGSVKTSTMSSIPAGNVELRALLAYWSNPSDVTIEVYDASDKVVATKKVTTGGAAEASHNNADFKFPEVPLRFNAAGGNYYVKYTLNTEGYNGMFVGGQKVYTYQEAQDGQQTRPSFTSAEQGTEYIFIAHDYGTEYQWYDADNEGLAGATPIAGATKPYIRYTASEYGNHYIYCMVTTGETKTRTGYAYVNVPMPPVRFTQDLDAAYEVTVGNSQTLTVEAKAGQETPNYQWYVNYRNDNPDEATPVEGATNASYTYTASEIGNAWVFCKATHGGISEISTVAKITATEFVFKNFELDLTNKNENILTTGGEQWIVVPDQGAIYSSKEATGKWNMHVLTATPHNDEHGFTNFQVEVPVTGAVAITIGGCNFNGGSSNIKVTTPEGVNITDTVPSTNTGTNCYHQPGHPSGTVYYTANTPTVLTITGPGYTPYISVKELTSAVKAPVASVSQAVGTTTVTLTCETDGANIFYKVGDGAKQTYTAPIAKTENCTITYWAENKAMANSPEQTCDVKIIGSNAVAYVYDSKYSTYCGLENDPLYKTLAENTTSWNLVPFDMNGMGADDVTKLDAYSALVISEAQSGSSAFGIALKNLVGTKPMVNMKTFFMGNGSAMDRWEIGSAFNPEHSGKGISTIKATDTYKHTALFEGMLFDGTETNLFNTDAEEYVKANHMQGVKDFKSAVPVGSPSDIIPLATVTGTDGTELTAIFAKGSKFINIGISCDNIQELNKNGIRLVSNALKLVMTPENDWSAEAAAGSIITGITYDGGKVDATEMGALSNGELAIQKANPDAISVAVSGSGTPGVSANKNGDIFTFTFDSKEYKVGFSDAAIKSITIGGHTLERWDGKGATLDIPRTGDLVIAFTKAMEANPVVTINGKKFVGTTVPNASPAGSAFTFHYLLDYSTRYNVNVLPPTFRTEAGVAFITPIRFNVQTEAAAAISKAGFNFIVDTNLPKDYDFKGVAHGDINAAIVAANDASTSATNRFRIFVPNGTYQVKDNTGATTDNGMTTLNKSNVSIIGQDMDKTIIVNKPKTPYINTTATIHLSATTDVYMQDITLKNNYNDLIPVSNGWGISLWNENAKGTILKNVKLWSNQDTYYSKGNNTDGSKPYKTYFETSTITGTVDFVCGHGDNWFEQCNLVLNNSTGVYIVAPGSSQYDEYGFVFNNCNVDKAAGATKVSDGSWWLGRPWEYNPRATFLNTTFNILPQSAGWTSMNNGLPIHFREFGSKDANGNLLDLSSRSVDACAGSSADNPVLTASEASQITIEAMFGSNDPRIHTTQVKAPVIGLQSAKVIEWGEIADALCYFVFVDDKLVSIQTGNTYNVDRNGTYTVRAANARGGLGAVSNTIRFTTDIPTAWTFGKEAWRSVSTDYWTPGTEDKKVADVIIETLNYQSLHYAFDGITDTENGGQLMENASVFLQTTNGLKFIVTNPTGDQLRYYSPATKYPECTGIKANGADVVVRIPILKGFPVVKITLDGVNQYLLTGATGTTEKNEGDLVPKSDLLGYYNYTVKAGHTLNAVALMKNSKLDEASVSQTPIYNPATRKWTYNVSHSFEYAEIKYYTGELTESTEFNIITNPGVITVNGDETFHVLVEDSKKVIGPSSVTDITAPSTGEVFNVTYIPDGVLANTQDMEDMNLKLSKAYSVKASGILHVDGEFLAANADGTVELSTPTTGTLTIEPATFRTDAQGKLDQWFVVYYTGTEAVAQSDATATFKIGGVAQRIKKNGEGDALVAYPFTYQRKEAQTDAATPAIVNNSVTWDWTKKTGEDINWGKPTTDEPNRYEFVATGNVEGMNDAKIGFDANKLITQGQVQFRKNDGFGNHFMGDYIGFKTKVNGTLRLTMGTTNPTAERRLIVKVGGNTVNTNYKMEGGEQIWDNQTWHFNSQNKKTFADIPITGVNTTDGTDVEITTMLYRPETIENGEAQGDYIPVNEPRPQYFWMYKMEFIADAVEPTIIVNDGTDSKPSDWKVTLDTGDAQDYIYYTLDGSDPTTASNRYSGPFDLPTNYTIKAKTLTPGKKASGVTTQECNYQLRHLTVKVPSGHGVINPTPLVESGNYIQGFEVELAPKAKMGYVFDRFTSDDKGNVLLKLTNNLYTISSADEQTVYAWFKNAPERQTTFMLADDEQKTDIESAGGEATGFTGAGLTLDYLAVPEDYTMYYPGHTLDYWYPSTQTETDEADRTKYYPGYASSEGTDAITLYPHFKKNSKTNYEKFPYRTRNISAHWDLRTAFGAQPMEVNNDVEEIKLTTHVNVINAVVEDVPLNITTNGGRINNRTQEDWCLISEGVKIELPSGKGATFRFATSAPLNSLDNDGTLIDGHHFDGYKEAQDDNGVTYYIYSYTTQNSDNHIILRIGDDYGYYKYIEADLPPADRAELTTSVNNKNMGQVKVTVKSEGKDAEGTEVSRDEANRLVATMYPRGAQVTLTAERSRYYELQKWQAISEDGKDTLNITNDMHYRDITFRIDGDDLTFDLMNYISVRAVFAPMPDYYVNFSAGKFASGLPPQQIHNEQGEMFQMPKANQTLYYDGHTLKYWEDADGNRYDFGQQYELNKNIVLYPVFEVNKYTLFDLGIDLENKHTDEATVIWNLTRSTDNENEMLAGPYLNYESTKGVLVSQLHFPNHVGEWIDMPLYIDAKTNYGDGRYAKVNNYATATTCQVNDGTIFTVLVSPNVQVRLEAADGRQITTTDIGGWHQGASGEQGYAVESWGGQTVGICYYGTKPTRDITFSSDAQYFKYVKARYIHGYYEENGGWKDGQHWVPRLNDDCTVDGVALSEDENTDLHELKNCRVRYTPQFGTDKMPDVKVTCGANGYVDIVQPTVDHPTAIINLHATDGVLISTYRIDFEIETPEQPVIKSVKVGGKDATFNSGSFNVSGDVAPSGTVQIEFDHTMKETMLSNFGQRMVAQGDGKVLSFNYWNLQDGSYTFSAECSALMDKYGLSCHGYNTVQLDKVNIHFNVSHTEHTVTKRLFNYIIEDNLTPEAKERLTGKGIHIGSADNAFTEANGAGGTERFYIYAPDGDYKLTGNTKIKPDYTSDGMIPAKGDGSRWEKSDFDDNIKGKEFANGITQINRSKISLIGESQESVRLWNLPIIEGISYTSTIAVGLGVTDFYCQDMVLENAFPYKASMDVQGSGSGAAGRAVAFWDKGNKTVMKNVSMLSWQDTYFSNNAADMRSYWEDCKIAGVVDFLCGDGNLWLERCELMLRDRSGNNIVAPRQPRTQKWGYVFNNCLITAEDNNAAASNEGSYTLGRPWAMSPAATFLYTRMEVKPKAVGWNNMNTDDVLRLHEYMSYNEDGETTVDLTGRSLRDCAPVAGSDDPILTDDDAAQYTLAAAMAGNDTEIFDPQARTAQRPAVKEFGIDDNEMSWVDDDLALCYFVYKSDSENGQYKLITIETKHAFNCEPLGKGWYKVRAANEYGGLGEWSEAIEYKTMESYELTMNRIYRDAHNHNISWSTICLPYNAKVPDAALGKKFKVYAVKSINDNTVILRQVSYITANKGYVVYGDLVESEQDMHLFKGSTHTSEQMDGVTSLLSGNPTSTAISATGIPCYTLAYKPAVSGIGFYKFTGPTLAPYKGYLTVETFNNKNNSTNPGEAQQNAAKRGITFIFEDFDDTVTDIYETVIDNDDDSREVIYDLNGLRIRRGQMKKGNVYIVNGRKVTM